MVRDMEQNGNCITIGIDRITWHPDYDYDTYSYDIALVRLKKNVTFTDIMTPICLPDTNKLKDPVTVVGWEGQDNSDDDEVDQALMISGTKNLLRYEYSNTTFANFKDCQDAYYKQYAFQLNETYQYCANSDVVVNETSTSTTITAQSPTSNATSFYYTLPKKVPQNCVGDSSGPLLQRNSNGNWSVVGLLNYRRQMCRTKNEPDVYLQVYKFVDWIKETIYLNQNDEPSFEFDEGDIEDNKDNTETEE